MAATLRVRLPAGVPDAEGVRPHTTRVKVHT